MGTKRAVGDDSHSTGRLAGSPLGPRQSHGQFGGGLWEPGHDITDREEQLLAAIAEPAAIAITNATLYQEKAHALLTLQETHEKVLAILDSITDGFYALDRHWRFTYLNHQAERLLRRTHAELLGKNAWEEFPEATSAITYQQFHLAMEEHVKVDFEVFHPPFAAWFAVHASPSADGLAVYFHDITIRKQAEETLLRLSSAVKTSIDSIVLTDLEGRIVEINEATLAMYGGDDPGDLVGQSAFELIVPDERARAVEGMMEVLEKGYLKEREYQVLRKDGSTIPVEMSVSLIADAAGTPIGFAGISRDIKARKQAAYELQQAKEAAEAANRAKDEFLATMSHELRTPVGIILGYLEILLDGAVGELAPAQRDILKKLDRNSHALFELINMVLDVNRLQAGGQLPLEVREVRVAELLAEVQTELQGLCEQSRLSCLWRVAADLPPLYTDPGKLKVVIKNLVNNAVKFTPKGSVTITAEEQRGGVEIHVTDTGIGIPIEVQAFMFEPFRQADSAPTRRYSGSGLGLYIVKHFLAMLGGSVTVTSEVGGGSTFCVWLPARIGAR